MNSNVIKPTKDELQQAAFERARRIRTMQRQLLGSTIAAVIIILLIGIFGAKMRAFR